MSHRQNIEQVLDLLVNEEHEAASDLLHSVIVEKAREMYEELVDEEFGGDAKEDFAGEIEADKDEIESEEIYDSEESDEDDLEDAEDAEDFESDSDDDDSEDGEIEDRVEDLEAALVELTAEFEQLVGGEEDEAVEFDDEDSDVEELDTEDFGDEDFGDEDFGDEDFGDEDGLEAMDDEEEVTEATKLQHEVSSPGMEKEGKLAGTGKNSKVGATGTQSQFTKAPSKADHGGKPHKIGGKDEAGSKAGQGKDHTPEDNINVPQKKVSASADEGDAGFVGTGKGSKKGAVNVKSPLGSGSGPRGV